MKGRWVIGWFIDGFGPGWVTHAPTLIPWTGDAAKASTFDSKEDAERKLIEWEIRGVGFGDY